MYGLWIPVMNRKLNDSEKKSLVAQLKRCNPDTILLVFNRVLWDEEKRQNELSVYIENKTLLEDVGFNVGAWLAPTIGYGAPFNPNDNNAPFTKLKRLPCDRKYEGRFDSEYIGDAYCPLDDRFVEDFCKLIGAIISTGVKTIMFEDDFTFTGGKTSSLAAGCCCDNHLERYRNLLGENIKVEDISDLIYKQGPNKYRKLWFQMQGDILREFCSKIGKYAHNIDPEVRIGLSANSSSYVQEGVKVDELAKIIAGNTKPFIRMTGAPYWKHSPMYATNIDAIRVQTGWCQDGIDLMTEGDTYPRPRNWVPASLLEAYDMILRADGKSHLILKYMLDYTSEATFETGYIDRHVVNKEVYEEIERRFKGVTTGLRIFEYPSFLETIEFDEDFPLENYDEGTYLPLVSQFFTADNSLPTTYDKTDDATLVFGENAKYIDENILNNGVILDAKAAKILFERGIDVGIEEYSNVISPSAEYFYFNGDRRTATTGAKAKFYNFKLKKHTEILSEFISISETLGVIGNVKPNDDVLHYPACYLYENKNGQRFMVYSFTAKTATVNNDGWLSGVFRSYYRQQQLTDGIKWLQRGRALPATCNKNPELYILCKRNGDELTVGLWNLFPDKILNPVIKLDGFYNSIDCYNCNGEIKDDSVLLKESIDPYDFAFFTVKY